MLKNTATSALNRFIGAISDHLASKAGLSSVQATGLRNELREGCRKGGSATKGYMTAIPAGSGKDTDVTAKQLDSAYELATKVVQKLIGQFSKHDAVPCGYSHKGDSLSIDVDCTSFKPVDDKLLKSFAESSRNGGSTSAALSMMDF